MNPPTALELYPHIAEAARARQSEVLDRLGTRAAGLTWAEAQSRLARFGRNELSSQRPPPWPAVLWAATKHPFNGVLAVLGLVSWLTSDIKATLVMASMIVLSVGLLTQTLIVHMIRTEKLPFLQSTAAPVVLATTAAVMVAGMAIPFSPLAPFLKLQPLPMGFFLYLPMVLIAYGLLTQLAKVYYIRQFKSWL